MTLFQNIEQIVTSDVGDHGGLEERGRQTQEVTRPCVSHSKVREPLKLTSSRLLFCRKRSPESRTPSTPQEQGDSPKPKRLQVLATSTTVSECQATGYCLRCTPPPLELIPRPRTCWQSRLEEDLTQARVWDTLLHPKALAKR